MEAGWELGQCNALEEEKALSSLMVHMYYTIHIDDGQLLFVASKGQLFVTFAMEFFMRSSPHMGCNCRMVMQRIFSTNF